MYSGNGIGHWIKHFPITPPDSSAASLFANVRLPSGTFVGKRRNIRTIAEQQTAGYSGVLGSLRGGSTSSPKSVTTQRGTPRYPTYPPVSR
jgi:hypothetical protein